MAKRCITCKIVKEDAEFYFRSDKRHLLQSDCKSCLSNKRKFHYKKNTDAKKERDKKYHLANKDKRNSYNRIYNKKNLNKRSALDKERYRLDLNFRLRQNISNRIRMALKRNSKSDNTLKLVGCSINELKAYLESKFISGMSWDNYGKWQIDHIKPCASFNLSNPDEQKECFHFSNLQPLWSIDNRLKSNKIIEKEVCDR